MGNPPRARKRVDAEATPTLKRARDGSAFTRCASCNKDVPLVLIDMHSCSLDASIKMKFESQIEERPAVSKSPPERKKKTVTSEKESKRKRSNKEKDPNMPKRPPTALAFFVFIKKFKEENPEDAKSGAKVAKEGSYKWWSMTTEEKKQYVDKAAEIKAEYEKAMEKYYLEKQTAKEDDAENSSNEE